MICSTHNKQFSQMCVTDKCFEPLCDLCFQKHNLVHPKIKYQYLNIEQLKEIVKHDLDVNHQSIEQEIERIDENKQPSKQLEKKMKELRHLKNLIKKIIREFFLVFEEQYNDLISQYTQKLEASIQEIKFQLYEKLKNNQMMQDNLEDPQNNLKIISHVLKNRESIKSEMKIVLEEYLDRIENLSLPENIIIYDPNFENNFQANLENQIQIQFPHNSSELGIKNMNAAQNRQINSKGVAQFANNLKTYQTFGNQNMSISNKKQQPQQQFSQFQSPPQQKQSQYEYQQQQQQIQQQFKDQQNTKLSISQKNIDLQKHFIQSQIEKQQQLQQQQQQQQEPELFQQNQISNVAQSQFQNDNIPQDQIQQQKKSQNASQIQDQQKLVEIIKVNRPNYFNEGNKYKFIHYFEKKKYQIIGCQLYLHYLDLKQFSSKWKTVSPTNYKDNYPNYHRSIALPNGEIFLIAGDIDVKGEKTSKIFKFVIQNEELRSQEINCQLSKPKNNFGICYSHLQNCIYIVGGKAVLDKNNLEILKDCERLIINNNQLQSEQLSPLIWQAEGPTLTEFIDSQGNNLIYKIGGYLSKDSKQSCINNSIERYDVKKNVWEQFTIDTQQFSLTAFCGAVQINESSILVFGGLNHQLKDQSNCYAIELQEKSVNLRGKFLELNKGHSFPHGQAFIDNNKVLCLGQKYKDKLRLLCYENQQWTISKVN